MRICGFYLVFFRRGYVIAVRVTETRDHHGALNSVPVANNVTESPPQASAGHGGELAGYASNNKRTDSGQLGGDDFWRPSRRIVKLKNGLYNKYLNYFPLRLS